MVMASKLSNSSIFRQNDVFSIVWELEIYEFSN